jgi:hypothetical protein
LPSDVLLIQPPDLFLEEGATEECLRVELLAGYGRGVVGFEPLLDGLFLVGEAVARAHWLHVDRVGQWADAAARDCARF